jgi:hypothetical protein
MKLIIRLSYGHCFHVGGAIFLKQLFRSCIQWYLNSHRMRLSHYDHHLKINYLQEVLSPKCMALVRNLKSKIYDLGKKS